MKPQLSSAGIVAFLAGRYARVEHLHQLAEGEESQAFAAVVDGHDVVVRTNFARDGFEKDEFVARKWPALRAPQVLTIEPISDAWLCISARVPGRTLQVMGGEAESYGAEVVEILDTIAASDTSAIVGFGPFDASGTGLLPSWEKFVVAVDGPQHLISFVGECRYDDQRGLIHGDFGSNNVLAANGQITGVIDWSEAMIGDPLYDIANLFFWRPWLDCMAAQCQHMERYCADRLADRDRLLRYQIRIGLQVAADAQATGDAAMERWALERCDAVWSGAVRR